MDVKWLLHCRFAILKVFSFAFLIKNSLDCLVLAIIAIDFIYFKQRNKVDIFFRIIIGFIACFLLQDLAALTFTVNRLSLGDAFRLLAADEHVIKTLEIAKEVWKHLTPRGKGVFAGGALLLTTGFVHAGYHDYVLLDQFNAAYDGWAINRSELECQLYLQKSGQQDSFLLKHHQLEDIQWHFKCCRIKQKFYRFEPNSPSFSDTFCIKDLD